MSFIEFTVIVELIIIIYLVIFFTFCLENVVDVCLKFSKRQTLQIQCHKSDLKFSRVEIHERRLLSFILTSMCNKISEIKTYPDCLGRLKNIIVSLLLHFVHLEAMTTLFDTIVLFKMTKEIQFKLKWLLFELTNN